MDEDRELADLKAWVNVNFELRDRALKIQHDASEQALQLATRTLEVRLDKLNELRAEVTSDRSNFITRIEFDSESKRIDTLEKWQAKLLGIGIVLALISAIIGAGIMKMFSGH